MAEPAQLEGETVLGRIAACELDASRVNPESPHRRELRRLLGERDLATAAALLFVRRLADDGWAADAGDLAGIVHEACERVAELESTPL